MRSLLVFTLMLITSTIQIVKAAEGEFPENLTINAADNRPILLILYSTDCPYCEALRTDLSNDKALSAALTQKYKLKFLESLSEEGVITKKQFKVSGVPAYIVYGADGQNIKVLKGYASPERLAEKLGLDYHNRTNTVNHSTDSFNSALVMEMFHALYGLVSICGNGILEVPEECDDGNGESADGCHNCQIQTGWYCDGSPSSCSTLCGDEIIAGAESCDDGNNESADGCHACVIQNGWYCDVNSICFTLCGDGIIAGEEVCDDGNSQSEDGCNSSCAIEPGWFCNGSPSNCSTVCGDGIVAYGLESCDDANVINGDGCDATCEIELNYTCIGSPSVCNITGDECSGPINLIGVSGTVNNDNTDMTTSTTPICITAVNHHDIFYQFTLASANTVVFNTTSSLDLVMSLFNGECSALTIIECDDDDGPELNPFIQIFLPAGTYLVRVHSYNEFNYGLFTLVYNLDDISLCGNGIINLGEDCDDGNLTNDDGCDSTCDFEGNSKGISINEDGTKPNPSAMLDVKSFDRGLLVPRMTTNQRLNIPNAATGLLVFDLTTLSFWFYNGVIWKEISTN